MIDDRIKTKNVKEDIKKLISPFLTKLKEKEEILAIMLLGGLSDKNVRSHLDEFSDIDISIFIKSKDHIPPYTPNYEFYIFDENGREIEVNVHEMIVDVEKSIDWDEGKKEAYSHAEYYFERSSEVREMVESKIAFDEEYRRNRLALIFGQYKWYVEINPMRAIKRGFFVNAFDLLNKGIELFYEALFLLNRAYQPHSKWRFEVSCDLMWTPDNYREKMEKAIISNEISEEAILQKRKYVIELFEDLLAKISEEYGVGVDFYHYACLNSYTDRQVIPKSYADDLYERTKELLSEGDKIYLYSLVNLELLSSDEEFKVVNIDKYSDDIKNVYNKVKGGI
ncbi:MAG: hypothetical protein J6C46_04280 [Clostridia bacterium]|nr:hypothetical protein [Clostridia bacterium]